jgi:hypothetical protein
MQIADLAECLGVARAVDAPDLTAEVIRFAAGRAIDTGVRVPLTTE